MAEQRLTQLVDRLEKVTSRLETVATRGGNGEYSAMRIMKIFYLFRFREY